MLSLQLVTLLARFLHRAAAELRLASSGQGTVQEFLMMEVRKSHIYPRMTGNIVCPRLFFCGDTFLSHTMCHALLSPFAMNVHKQEALSMSEIFASKASPTR
ncbi:hypothetical protein F5887DRAFT_625701 [Amanita rubescens]|nr:hypothetical protein F5887DRAFT_625701 [Amanita rubescens]